MNKPLSNLVHYRTTDINGVNVFYREAGPEAAPVMLLLHGFPTSSNMFRTLIPRLSQSFRLIALDYPGFGQSAAPDRSNFAYTFEHLTDIVEALVRQLGLEKFSLYLMDYGAPIGYRLALRLPESVQTLVIQNGNAYDEGLAAFWDPIKKYWDNPTTENRKALHFLVEPKATKWQYENGVDDTTLLDPSTWTLDQLGLDRPGNDELQLDLFYDYRTNVPLYPKFQEFFRKYQPPALIVWGKNDYIFPAEGAVPYERDLTQVERYMLDTGHFALETHADVIADHILAFVPQRVTSGK
jgi:pimeloyl-ACP methyl ester carboxylesterase